MKDIRNETSTRYVPLWKDEQWGAFIEGLKGQPVVVVVSDETDNPSYQAVTHPFGTPTTMKLSITRDLVARFTRALLTLNGSTTTLDVKTALRDQGFFAKQDQVSAYMQDIAANDGDISFVSNNGQYREYAFTIPASDDDADVVVDRVAAALASFKQAVQKSNIPIGGLRPSPAIRLVQSSSNFPGTTIPLHRDNRPARYTVTDEFDGNLRTYDNITRGQAKARWARETGRRLFEARTQKVSN